MPTPIVNEQLQLQRMQMKGGWTYLIIGNEHRNKAKAFGMLKVYGTIDDYALSKVSLMPMKNGSLFLPVKAEIRKKIKKEEGDWVTLVLYTEEELAAPCEADFLESLADEPAALVFYQQLNKREQKAYIDWIFETKIDEQQVDRMAASVNRLARGLTFKSSK
ncbi:bacteriocin resistance YdeI/OmpD-like protein [Chitinophaga skermanii]|uniref:Bacteriocin resistance YdeI/OmpD-like protein n=1 Tax=Chitinophaga skermanii TaxID=331697 RepID=A0A327Q3M1_9BACT|nr:YdeI/OmpD-associated family protein [Chitinophaga skermanii]RAI98514.1 bacteriocin resistance YdeI/OmpD-like protein [Chitinophaga skermanii]